MLSKTQIAKRTEKKRNPHLIEMIREAKKNNIELAKRLSAPNSHYISINVGELKAAEGEIILVVGKVLGSGTINKKLTIAALAFSEQAQEKLKKADCQMITIKELLEKNKTLKGVKIL
ncbi:MAG: hypothetical protein RL557_487 [archaeon]|jgi:large subunit ribosomal protein L18e